MRIYAKQFAVASAALLAAAALAYQAAITTLYKDGKIVSSNLRMVDGTLYVPVKDVATFEGGTLNVTADRADIKTSTDPAANDGLAQKLIQEVAPPISVPSPIASASTPPPPPPAQLTGTLNQDVVFDGFSYRITSIDYRDREYKDQFDQRGTKLHPQWKSDRLVILYVTVKNVGNDGGSPTIPGTSDFSIFDAQKVAYPTSAVDMRQAPAVLGQDDEMTMDYSTPLSFLAPGGQLSYAVIGSVPKGNLATMVRFHVSSPSFPDVQPTPQPEPAVMQSNGTTSPAQPAQQDTGADITINLSHVN